MSLSSENRERFAGYLERGVISRHLVLYGKPGWGKTTITEILKEKLYPNWVFPVTSTQTGKKDYINDHVVGFMKTGFGRNHQLVIFEEASGLSREGAEALRV